MRLVWFFPVAGLVLVAGLWGLRLGHVPSETEIINRYAALYLQTAGQGARATDCAATSHPSDDVRMVISCNRPDGLVTMFFVNRRGALVPEPAAPAF